MTDKCGLTHELLSNQNNEQLFISIADMLLETHAVYNIYYILPCLYTGFYIRLGLFFFFILT
ncbi:MAG: hypothetical protein A2Z47_07935 [Thermodesulfovibrio sp. RBG_19FT_COMBO_42_12]|nr:MAG: hypothetical protein A2Z47_07935 [Thermodesulfovibrio sp. RBG_19FT_COMBO_42_12]